MSDNDTKPAATVIPPLLEERHYDGRRMRCFAERPAHVDAMFRATVASVPSNIALVFDGVRVPATDRLGEEGDGFAIAMRTLDRSRPGIAAQAVGIAQGALEVATAYARERRQFGQRVGDFQMVGAMLADMDAQIESARQLLYKACIEIDAGAPDASRWSALCKLVAGDAAMRVTTDAVQVLGGYGYIDEFPVERMMRDAKITQLYEGTQQVQRLVIARALLGKDG